MDRIQKEQDVQTKTTNQNDVSKQRGDSPKGSDVNKQKSSNPNEGGKGQPDKRKKNSDANGNAMPANSDRKDEPTKKRTEGEPKPKDAETKGQKPDGKQQSNDKNKQEKKENKPKYLIRQALQNSFPTTYVSWDDCLKNCRADGRRLNPGQGSLYVSKNCNQYYLAINMWCSMVADCISDRVAFEFADTIRIRGMLTLITEADDIASRYIRQLNGDTDAIGEIDSYCFTLILTSPLNDEMKLQILRFPKRFTLCEALTLRDESLTRFWDIQNKLNWMDTEAWERPRKWDSGCPQYHDSRFMNMIDALRPYLDDMLSMVDFSIMDDEGIDRTWRLKLCETPGENPFKYDYSFSSGSAQEGKAKRSKIHGIRKYQEYWLHPMYRLGNYQYKLTEDIPPYAVEPQGVPKSAKAYRIICAEDAYHNMVFGRACRFAYRVFKKKSKYRHLINLDDQDRNRDACREGSIDGSLATVDITSASDSITIFHLNAFPQNYREFVLNNRAKYGIKGKQRLKLLTALTSGNPITFFTECCFYLACALLACDMARVWCNNIPDPYTYGDDIIIDVRAVGALMMIFETLKITAQPQKTFSTGYYRESCGVEYYMGWELTNKYWPRNELLTDADSLSVEDASSLISLQHRIRSLSWKCDRTIRTFIRAFYPKMTSSYPGTECSDLWEDCPVVQKVRMPLDKARVASDNQFTNETWPMYDAHYAITTGYPTIDKRDPAVEMYLYAEFLAHGTQSVDDPVLEECGVTLPVNRGAVYTRGETRFKLTTDI